MLPPLRTGKSRFAFTHRIFTVLSSLATETHSVHYYASPLVRCNSAAEPANLWGTVIEVKLLVFMPFNEIRRSAGGPKRIRFTRCKKLHIGAANCSKQITVCANSRSILN